MKLKVGNAYTTQNGVVYKVLRQIDRYTILFEILNDQYGSCYRKGMRDHITINSNMVANSKLNVYQTFLSLINMEKANKDYDTTS